MTGESLKRRLAAGLLSVLFAAGVLTGCYDSGKTTSTVVGAQPQEEAAVDAPEPSGTADAPVVTLRFAGTVPESSPAYAECEWFCQQVLEDSNGTLKIVFYPYNQLGDDLYVYDEIISGSIAMGLLNPLEKTQMATVGKIPGIALSEDEFKQYFGPGSYLDRVTNEALAEVGITCFGTYFGGITGVATNKEAKEPANPKIYKGVVLRSPISTAYKETLSCLGFTVKSMPYTMTYDAIESGSVNGYGGGMPHTVVASFSDIVTYYYDYKLVPSAMCAMINTEVYNSLSEEHQKILAKRYTELVERSYTAFGDYENMCLDYLEEEGITVVRFTEEEEQRYIKRIREQVWPELEKYYGKEFFDQLKVEMELE